MGTDSVRALREAALLASLPEPQGVSALSGNDQPRGFTPGPWYPTNHFADDTTPCNCAYVLSDGYAGSICNVSFDNGLTIADGGDDSPAKAEAAANANLIAAAPELLDALENLVIGIGMGWDLDGIIEASNAAISKARAL